MTLSADIQYVRCLSGAGGEKRYGFNGQEKDDEISGVGNNNAFEFRMLDPRLGRFASVDPIRSSYPWNSPYALSENMVIHGADIEGLEFRIHIFPAATQKPTIVQKDADNVPIGHIYVSTYSAEADNVDDRWGFGAYCETIRVPITPAVAVIGGIDVIKQDYFNKTADEVIKNFDADVKEKKSKVGQTIFETTDFQNVRVKVAGENFSVSGKVTEKMYYSSCDLYIISCEITDPNPESKEVRTIVDHFRNEYGYTPNVTKGESFTVSVYASLNFQTTILSKRRDFESVKSESTGETVTR